MDYLEKLPDKPTGDDPPPFPFEYALEQLAEVKDRLQRFEEALRKRLQGRPWPLPADWS
jgi:hypothetical protein